MKIKRSYVKIALWLVLISLMIPFLGVQSYMSSDQIVKTEVVYRDGFFGPTHKMVTDSNGVRMYVIDYPWYYFKDLPSMNIYGIVGHSSSNDISFVMEKGIASKDITFKQQHDLYFPQSIWNKYPDATKATLTMYNGLPSDGKMYFTNFDPYKTKATVQGPFSYGQTWATTLTYYNSWDLKEGSTYDYTVQETIYIDGPITDVGYNTDRAFVHVTIPKPGATTGTLTVTVLDNLKALPVSIRLFKDGQVYQDTVYLTGGTKTFSNLPFGTYNVQVLRDDYNVFFYDAFPAQSGYDYSTGKVQLSTTVNTCNYMIYGITDQTKADGSSGFDSGTDQIPGVDDAKESIRDIIFGDGDSGLSKIILFGLPLFMIIIIAGLGFYYYKLGDSKNGKK